MTYKLIIKPDAEREIKDALAWYESKHKGLGFRFLNIIKAEIAYLQKYPEHFQIQRYPFRQISIAKFPYVILFTIQNDTVVIYSLFNTHQNLAKKSK